MMWVKYALCIPVGLVWLVTLPVHWVNELCWEFLGGRDL